MKIWTHEITLKPYTRGIERQVNEITLEGVIFHANDQTNLELPVLNTQRGEQKLIELMSWLSSEQLDDLPAWEYEKLKNEINKKIEGEKKSEQKSNKGGEEVSWG